MGLKQELREAYGLEVLIASGSGPKHDPFVLEPCSEQDALFTQLEALRGLTHRAGWLYTLIGAEMAPEIGPKVQRIAFQRVRNVEGAMQKDEVACYFDLSAVEGQPNASQPLFMWGDPRSPIMLPHELGWMHFSGSRDHAGEGRPLDQSCSYHMPGATATVYVYEHGQGAADDERGRELRDAEVAQVTGVVLGNGDGFEDRHGGPAECGPFAVKVLSSADRQTVAAVACMGAHFIKVRMTYEHNEHVAGLASETVMHLAGLVELFKARGQLQ